MVVWRSGNQYFTWANTLNVELWNCCVGKCHFVYSKSFRIKGTCQLDCCPCHQYYWAEDPEMLGWWGSDKGQELALVQLLGQGTLERLGVDQIHCHYFELQKKFRLVYSKAFVMLINGDYKLYQLIHQYPHNLICVIKQYFNTLDIYYLLYYCFAEWPFLFYILCIHQIWFVF